MLQNPNIRGSGYIEHPPQVPFAGKVVMQPSTLNLEEETPEWFANGPSGPQQTRYHPSDHHPGHPTQQAHPGPPRLNQHIPAQLQSTQGRDHRSEPVASGRSHHPESNAGGKMPLNADIPPVEEKKLSKAAKAKLRKKLREGRA